MNNRVHFSVKPFPIDEPREFIVAASIRGNDPTDEALIAVFRHKYGADTFAEAMNNAMDLADGHPRAAR